MRLRDASLLIVAVVLILLVFTSLSTPALNDQYAVSLFGGFHAQKRPSLRTIIRNDTVLWFLHMQKTGGTFFSAFLLYAFDCVCPANWRPEWAWSFTCQCPKRLLSMFSPGDAAIYHANYTRILRHWKSDGYEEKYAELKIFTVLREPIARVLSEYHHCSKRRRIACWGSFKNVTDKDWIRLRRYPNVFFEHPTYDGHNRQTRMLLGEAWHDPVTNHTSEIDELANFAIKRLERVRKLPAMRAVNCAASIRRHLGKAGGEPPSVLLAVLSALLQPICANQAVALVPNQRAALWLPHTPSDHALTHVAKHLLSWIEAQNAIDTKVYKRAVELFEERLAKMKLQQDSCPT